MRTQFLPLALLSVCMLAGCESSDTTDRIAKLQEQIGRVAQQLNETKKQVDGLQEANQRSTRTLENLEATVERLHMASVPPKNTRKLLTEQDILPSSRPQDKPGEMPVATAPPVIPQATGEIGSPPFQQSRDLLSEEPSLTARQQLATASGAVSCAQVWKQLGQGKSEEAAARALGVPVSAIRACEQKVGRSGAGR